MRSLFAFSLLLLVPVLIFGTADDKNKPVYKAEFKIAGMTCSACAGRVEEAIRAEKNVSAVEVAWEKGIAAVTLTQKLAKDDYKSFFARMAQAGFKLEHIKDTDGNTYGISITCCGPKVCPLDQTKEKVPEN